MKAQRIVQVAAAIAAGALMVTVSMLTIGRGRGQCPQCGYMGDLNECKHCGWTACLTCWQRLSQHNTCPSCGRYGP